MREMFAGGDANVGIPGNIFVDDCHREPLLITNNGVGSEVYARGIAVHSYSPPVAALRESQHAVVFRLRRVGSAFVVADRRI